MGILKLKIPSLPGVPFTAASYQSRVCLFFSAEKGKERPGAEETFITSFP